MLSRNYAWSQTRRDVMQTTRAFFQTVFLACTLVIITSCGGEDEFLVDKPEIGELRQALDSARTRVMQEASQAMTGSWSTYNENSWPTGTNYANYAYTLADRGAWNKLLASPRYGNGYFVSCSSYHNRSPNYGPCSVSWGAFEMPYYTCQGYCPSMYMRGGQCKPFMNLVAYRSGIYQTSGYGFKSFPADGDIANLNGSPRPTNDPDMPLATYANILPGDFLRRPDGHATIVVSKINSLRVVVFDSNWTGTSGVSNGNGYEIVSSHELGFSGSGSWSDLGTYRVLKCVYTGRC